jgi:hypothetical protein
MKVRFPDKCSHNGLLLTDGLCKGKETYFKYSIYVANVVDDSSGTLDVIVILKSDKKCKFG